MKIPQHAPATAIPIQYGAKGQNSDTDTTPRLSEERIRLIQDIVGTFFYYGRFFNPTLGATINSIASLQSNGTIKLEYEVQKLLDYCATHPNTGVR